VAVNSSTTVYVADAGNNTLRKITSAGAVTTLAGSAGVAGGNDGTGSAAQFYQPYGVTVDASGNIYVADTSNNTIRKSTTAGVVTTLAGSLLTPGNTDTAILFYYPSSLSVDSSGNIYVADTYNQTIRKLTPTLSVSTVAGSLGVSGTANGTGTAARFCYPMGVAVNSGDIAYVADSDNETIRKITSAGVVSTLAGKAAAS
jgi:sugar lactone lactonase YvrE